LSLLPSKHSVLQTINQPLQAQLPFDQAHFRENISQTDVESSTTLNRKSIVVDSLKQNSSDKNKSRNTSSPFLKESKRVNNMAASTYLSVLAAVVALMIGAVYLFGVPPQWKRAMEEKALETMGENKASYLVKGMHTSVSLWFEYLANIVLPADQINSLPASDQKDISELKSGVGNLVGGALQNPLGKEAGQVGDSLTSPLTGR
jgi:hypothetical protein